MRNGNSKRSKASTLSSIGAWALVGIFAMAGAAKLMGAPMLVESYNKWGFSHYFMYGVGAWEIATAVLIAYRKTRVYGTIGASMAMVGASFTHLLAHELGAVFVPMSLLALSVWITWRERPSMRFGPVAQHNRA